MNRVVLTAVLFSSLTVSVSASAAGMARRAVPFNYGTRTSSAASVKSAGYRVSNLQNRGKALSYTPISTKKAYAWRRDFGKSNLRKWSSTEGMDTPWRSNSTTDTAHFKASTVAFLDHLNDLARRNGVTFVITGGAERGYHASGTYSHENGYKVDISDEGAMWGSKPFKVLHLALAPSSTRSPTSWTMPIMTLPFIPTITGDGIPGGINTEK